MNPALAVLRSLVGKALLRRSRLSEWIVTLDYYRNGPLGLLLLVRDEADIIRENLLFHLQSGVDFVIITDNGSTDGTRDILADFSRLDNVLVVDEPKQNYEQARWVSRMVRLARSRFRAKWVIPADADEFWLPQDGNYRTDLRHASNVFHVYWNNMLPGAGKPWQQFTDVGDFWSYNSKISKVLCATAGFYEIGLGNHDVRIVPKVVTEAKNIRLYHYPCRSFEQFERKIVNAGRSIKNNKLVPTTAWHHWRNWYEAYENGSLSEVYAALTGPQWAVRVDDTMATYFERERRRLTRGPG